MSLRLRLDPLSISLIAAWCVLSVCRLAGGADHFLVIAGGYSPTGNQASLEKNVLFFQRLIDKTYATKPSVDVYFADGLANKPTLQVKDADSLPQANRLMAEFFGSQRNLGLTYRSHQVPGVRGATSPGEIRSWFAEAKQRVVGGDRLFLYVSAHGGASRASRSPFDTSIYLWNNQRLTVSELDSLLGQLPDDVQVIAIMVQCHAGGFARLIFDQTEPDRGVARQTRCGFFATVHDRPAAGCTPEVDEADYEEYSSYFWAALAGAARTGETIESPDYDANGQVTFNEAHAYTLLASNSIDLPIKTSGEFLRQASRFAETEDATEGELLGTNIEYDQLLELAGPVDRVVLERLSEQLNLQGPQRLQTARREGSRRPTRTSGRGRFGSGGRGGSSGGEVASLRRRIADDVRKRWPELANVLNPVAIDLLTSRADEFVSAIESHKDYRRYRQLATPATKPLNEAERRVKYERFARVADNVILAANLKHVVGQEQQRQLERILAAEAGAWGP